jgi:hypothetical protein
MYLLAKTSAKIFTQENCAVLHVSELRILMKSIVLKIGYDQYLAEIEKFWTVLSLKLLVTLAEF